MRLKLIFHVGLHGYNSYSLCILVLFIGFIQYYGFKGSFIDFRSILPKIKGRNTMKYAVL